MFAPGVMYAIGGMLAFAELVTAVVVHFPTNSS